jgi:anti-sigma regulatory factor (Ser/Thr protein kinase)
MDGLNSCGDAAVIARCAAVQLFVVIDALGHGPDAEVSAHAAAAAVRANASGSLTQVFGAVHAALKGLRGVVMAAIREEGGTASFAGVGNVDIFGPAGVSRPISTAGILGGARYRLKEFALAAAGQRWVLLSDGVRPRDVPALLGEFLKAPPQQVAEALVARAGREHDDACALVMDFGGNGVVSERADIEVAVASRLDAVAGALAARDMVKAAGMDELRAAELQLVVAELAGNAVCHAGSGVLRLRIDGSWVEISVEDRGSGFSPAVLQDAGRSDHLGVNGVRPPADGVRSFGSGLACARRLSQTLTLENLPGGGARVCARIPL